MFQHKLHPAWVPRVIAPQSGPRWKSGPQNHLPVKNVWTKLHYLLDPGFTELLVIPNEFLNFSPMNFDITSVILLNPQCVAAPRRYYGNPK